VEEEGGLDYHIWLNAAAIFRHSLCWNFLSTDKLSARAKTIALLVENRITVFFSMAES
jgi:hypothetical protein